MEKQKGSINEIKSIIKNTDWLELVYLALFGAFIIKEYLGNTALDYDFPTHYSEIIRIMMMVYVVARIIERIVLKRIHFLKELPLMILILVCFALSSYYSQEIMLFDFALFLVGAKDVSFKKIAWVYLIIAVQIQVIAYISVKIGLAPNYTYESSRGIRRSMGICFPTDYAAHVLFIMMVYNYIRYKKITFFEITGMAIVTYVVYTQSLARNDCLCMAILLVLILVNKIWPNLFNHRYFYICCGIVFIILASTMIILSIKYNTDSQLMIKLDKLFSTRLQLGHQGIQQYGYSLWGQPIYEVGGGYGGLSYDVAYFFIDSSYIRILLKYGIIMIWLVVVIHLYCVYKSYKYNLRSLIIVYLVIAVFSTLEHHYLELSFNPFLIILFARIDELITKRGVKI